MLFYAKLKADKGDPYPVYTHNRYTAALFLTNSTVDGAVIQVWSEREWNEQQEPREYTVTRVDFSDELKLI